MKIALYVSEITRSHLFCTSESLLSTDLGRPLSSFGVCQAVNQ